MPFVHVNFAIRSNGDGNLRFDAGSSGAADLRRVHELRETYPGIAVGRRTFEGDQPRLTARAEHLGKEPLSQPRRFVLTRSARFLPPAGYERLLCPDGNIGLALDDQRLCGLGGILIEAGPTLLDALLRQALPNALTIYVNGRRPEEMLRQLYRLIPSLPRCYGTSALGEGYLFTFHLMAEVRRQPDDLIVTPLRTSFGHALLYTFRDQPFGLEHGALVYGNPSTSANTKPPLLRIHSECWTSSLMKSIHCDCQEQLAEAHLRIANEGRGVLILHNAEGRGIGRLNKTAAYRLQRLERLDTLAANVRLGLPEDAREYFSISYRLRRLGITRVRLLSNNPLKADCLRQTGIDVVEQIPLGGFCHRHNVEYLTTKVQSGHDSRLLVSNKLKQMRFIQDLLTT